MLFRKITSIAVSCAAVLSMTVTPIHAETVPEDETEPVQSELISEPPVSSEEVPEVLSGKQENESETGTAETNDSEESEEPEEELKETEEESSAGPAETPEAEGKVEAQKEEVQEEEKKEEENKEENKEDREFKEEGETRTADSYDGPTSEESFSLYFSELLKSRGVEAETGSAQLSSPVLRRESLEEKEQFYYDLLLERAILVANGEESSTLVTFSPDVLPKSSLTNAECQELFGEDLIVNGGINPKAKDYLYSFVRFDMELVLNALRADYPQYFYWADRGESVMQMKSPSMTANRSLLRFDSDGSIAWRVSPAYRSDSGVQYETNVTKIKGVQNALNNAEDIATTQASGKTDYEKLLFFNDKVDELTDYNYDARDHSEAYSAQNINPWEVIYVFDGDPDTKVVCEGYAKAFKLLCDLAEFRKDIRTYAVTGNMNGDEAAGGAHMWNIVRMGDGKNYLVDPTCNDTLGSHNLFLAGATGGSVADGYIIQWGDTPLGNGTIQKGKTMSYVYDSDTKSIYTESELELSDSNYADPGDDPEAPEITGDPEDAAVTIGEKAEFSVRASGEGLSYQWQLSRDNGINWVNLNGTKFPSALTADFEITGSKSNNGYLFRCVVTDQNGETLTSGSAKLTVDISIPFEITSQPEDAEVTAGENAQFSVRATGEGLSYQWQLSKDNGVSWVSLSGTKFPSALTADFEIRGSKSSNGNSFRCVVSDQNGQTVTSESAKLTLKEQTSAPAITSQPEDAVVTNGENAQFSVRASGEGLSYQWQLSRDNGINWVNLNKTKFPSALTADFEIKASKSMNGYLFRCIVTDQNGQSAESDRAKLTVEIPLSWQITSQPEDTVVTIGETAQFHVRADGEGLSYQWQLSRDNGINWVNLKKTKFPSAVTADFAIKGSKSNNGYLFRCAVTDQNGQSAESDRAKLTVEIPVTWEITSQPEDTTVTVGENALFSVRASGEGLSYQWQLSRDNGINWVNLNKTKFPSAVTADFAIKGSKSNNGFLFRCIVTDQSGQKAESSGAKLTVESPIALVITSQPEDTVVTSGETAQFHVTANGEGLSYQWQLSRDNGINWANLNSTKFPSALSADFEIKASKSVDGYLFRCVVSDQSGVSLTSGSARLETYKVLKILADPQDTAVNSGETAEFTVSAEGNGLSYQWQYSEDGSYWHIFSDDNRSAKTKTLSVPADSALNQYVYRCTVTDRYETALTSDWASLTVHPKLIFHANGGVFANGYDLSSDKETDTICGLDPDDPVIIGYRFSSKPNQKILLGWSSSPEEAEDEFYDFSNSGYVYATEYSDIGEDKEYWACWAKGYHLEMDANGGHFSNPNQTKITVESDNDQIYFEIPEKEGYEFYGWADANGKYPDLRAYENEIQMYSYEYGDYNLKAIWGNKITITLIGTDWWWPDGYYDETASGEFEFWNVEDVVFNPLNHPQKAFLGWSKKANASSPEYLPGHAYRFETDTTLYPVFGDGAVITFDYNDSQFTGEAQSTIQTIGVKYGENVGMSIWPGSKTKDGHTYYFVGWNEDLSSHTVVYDDSTEIVAEENKTYYGVWGEEIAIVLDYQKDLDQTGKNYTYTEYIYAGTQFNFSIGLNEIWEFYDRDKLVDGKALAGFSTVSGAADPEFRLHDTIRPEKEATYYAVWKDPITITFQRRCEDELFNRSYSVNKIVRKTVQGSGVDNWIHREGVIRRSGYTLIGFTTDPAGNEVEITEDELDDYSFMEDTTLYAVWKLGEDDTISGNGEYTISGNGEYTISGNGISVTEAEN